MKIALRSAASWLAIPLLGILFLELPSSATAGPRDELLRLVPADVNLCVTIQNLREFTKPSQEALGADFNAALSGKNLKLPAELQAILREQEKVLRELKLEVTPQQALNDILGDAIVLAYRKGAGDKPEQGMLLIWAREPKLLVQVIDRVNAYQRRSGELVEVREESADGRTYSRRVKKDGKGADDEFYSARGNVFCFTTSIGLMREALALADSPAKDVSPLAQQLQKLAVDKALVSVWLNPRSIETELAQHERTAKGAEKAFLSHFLQYWSATDGIAFFMSADPMRVETGLALRVNKSKLPTAAQRFLSEAARPSALWQVIPDDALFALAGRIEGASFAETMSGFINAENGLALRSAVEAALASLSVPRGQFAALATGIGPDWGLWSFYSSAEPKKALFPQLLLAVRLRSGDNGAHAQDALLDALQGVSVIVCASAGGKITQEKERDGQVEIRYLVGEKFPPGLRPAYAAKGGYFLLAGSPETIRAFQPPAEAPKADVETPLLRISLNGWRKYLSDNREKLAEYLSAMQGTTPDVASIVLGNAIESLEGMDRLEILVRSEKDDQTAVVIRLKANQQK